MTIGRERAEFYLPDFCRAQSVLAVILIAELVAMLLTLARVGFSGQFWPISRRLRYCSGAGSAAASLCAAPACSQLDVLRGSLFCSL